MNKELYKKIYLYSIGFLWIVVIIYLRFIRTRAGYTLTDLKKSLTPYFLFTNMAFILLHIVLLAFAIFVIIQKDKKDKEPNKIILWYKQLVNMIITKPLESIRDIIAPHIPGSGIFYCKYAEFIDKNETTRTKIFVIIFSFIPRMIMASIFFIELTLYNKLEFFIYSLTLIIMPICWSLFIDLFTDFGKRLLEDIPKVVKVTPTGELLENGWYSGYKFEPYSQFKYEADDLKEYADTWGIAIKIYVYGESYFKEFTQKTVPFVTLFTSTLYLSASIYKLIFIIS